MNKYIVRINCTSFEDIEIEANSKEEAVELARTEFICPQEGCEFGEFITN